MPDEIIGNGTNGLSRMARMEQELRDINKRLERIEAKIDHCPVNVHTAYFKIIGAVLVVMGGGIVGLMIKVFSP